MVAVAAAGAIVLRVARDQAPVAQLDRASDF
jgi:hypothetical protein